MIFSIEDATVGMLQLQDACFGLLSQTFTQMSRFDEQVKSDQGEVQNAFEKYQIGGLTQ